MKIYQRLHVSGTLLVIILATASPEVCRNAWRCVRQAWLACRKCDKILLKSRFNLSSPSSDGALAALGSDLVGSDAASEPFTMRPLDYSRPSMLLQSRDDATKDQTVLHTWTEDHAS